MTTTLRLLYSASLDRAEYLDGGGHWSPVHPIPPAHPDTPQEQRLCDAGGLHVQRGTRYRATSRLLSHLPPFRSTLTRTAPAPIALEMGLRAPDYADDGYIYISAAAQSLHIPRDTTLLIAHHTISDIDAIEGACMALRRAGMAGDAEQFRWAAESSRTLALRHLGALISVIVPAFLALRQPTPPDQLDPARDLIETLGVARKIMMGEALA